MATHRGATATPLSLAQRCRNRAAHRASHLSPALSLRTWRTARAGWAARLACAICCVAGVVAWSGPAAAVPEVAPPAPGTVPGPAPETAPSPFTGRHFQALARHLADGDLLLQTAAGGVLAGAVAFRDDDWNAWVVDHRPLGGAAYDVGYHIGHRSTQAALTLAITAGGLIARDQRLRDTGLLLVEAHLLSAGLSQVMKGVTDRRRPDGGDLNSLPSGHAVAAWTMAEVLQRRLGWWVGAPAFAAALYTGESRVQGNRHHPSDVIASFALAHWIAGAVCRAAQPQAGRDPGQRAPAVQHSLIVEWLPVPPVGASALPLLSVHF
jgi:membrane-associated phospholipid phosphatase